MSDRLFASAGEPAPGGRPRSERATYGEDTPPYPVPAVGATEAAALGVARRLQARLERQERLLAQLNPAPPQLRELTESTRRARRDAASIALLTGDDPGGHGGGPRRLSEVLDDAAGAAEETWRILIRPAAAATMDPGPAVELTAVLAELLDHVTAAYPDAGIDVASQVSERSGLAVEVSVNSAGRHLPDGLGTQRAAATAQAHAHASRSGLSVALPDGGPPAGGTGVVAIVRCPPAAIAVEETAWSAVVADRSAPVSTSGVFATNGNGTANGNGNGNGHHGNGLDPATLDQPAATPDYSPSTSSRVDELFGPLVDLPAQPEEDGLATPIFAAIASAWFRDEPEPATATGTGPTDWESPSDGEWRAAAERAAHSEPLPSTASGLPRRRPGEQLVPPPRERNGTPVEPPERAPDRVRNRLSTYQRGLHQGRHRAPTSESEHW